MDIRLSPEQLALRDSAAQVAGRLGPQAVAQLDDSERVAKLDAAVEASGWRELRAAVEGRAPLASAVEVGIVAEELGRGLGDVSFLGPTLAAELRRLASAPPAPSPETVAFLPDLSALVTADASEPSPQTPPAGGALSTGAAVAVDARGVSSALVLVPTAGGYAVAEASVPYVPETAADAGVDLTRPTVALGPSVSVVPVPDQARVLTAEDVTRWMALGLAVTSADLVGTMQGAVELAAGYARERRQFGRAVGSFQAVQHLLADALVATEGSRSAALHAAWAVDSQAPDEALATAAVAKAYCARAARTVCETAIQVHGGIGNTWECLAHVHLRRTLVSTGILGGVGPNLDRILDHHGISSEIDHNIGGARGFR